VREGGELNNDNRLMAPGRRAIKITSVLFIINGSIWIPVLVEGITLHLSGVIFSQITVYDWAFVYGFFPLAVGIFGLLFSNNVRKAMLLCILGVLALVAVFTRFSSFLGWWLVYMAEWWEVLYIAVMLMLQIVYLYGAGKNLKVNREQADQV